MPNEFSPELQSILEEEGITEQPAKAAETPTETSVEVPEIVTPEPEPSEEEGFDLGGAALDVTIGIPEAVGMGP